MKDRLFRTKKELSRALSEDIKTMNRMKRRGDPDYSGVAQVVKNKRKLMKDKDYWSF